MFRKLNGSLIQHARLAVLASGLLLSLPVPVRAADFGVLFYSEVDAVAFELGTRYWASFGRTGKDLYDSTGALRVSRLTYDDLVGQSGEVYGQVTDRSWFLKGNAGLGSLIRGALKDEDFPPVVTPYSSTDSRLEGGMLYATVDYGRYLFERSDGRIGAFVGYNFLRQTLDAFGCTQTATNPDICVPPIGDGIAAISQDNDWHSLRVGINGEADFGTGWRLRGEAAFLPWIVLSGADSHWLRICDLPGCFTGAIPEDGRGWGFQLEAMLDYRFSNRLSLGVGGRYWHMATTGDTHFEDHVVGFLAVPQPVDWTTDLFGVTAQLSMTF